MVSHMNEAWKVALVAAYVIPAVLLMFYSFNLYMLVCLWLLRRRGARAERERLYQVFEDRFSAADLSPVVTQIPVYNEYNVVERVMRAAVAMEYPAGRHTVQVLDDSNDETVGLVDRVAAELRGAGHDVQVIRRPNRIGFKAGALEYGMAQTPADLFAIFDADFVPPPDFLLRTVPVLLVRTDLGLVQARWGHLNEKHSLITRAEAIGIDGHFTIDQGARAWNGLFMNFNGTAGLWRRQAIEDGGGWEHDTLTEDLDLSYRSQLAGWKCYYLPDLVVPAELPENINAFKTQQFRWAKGSIQTAIKIIPRVLRSNARPMAKLQAIFHMTYYAVHPLMVWMALISLPMLHYVGWDTGAGLVVALTVFFMISSLAPHVMYGISQCVLHRQGWKRLLYLPVLTVFGVGIAVSNTRAVLEALVGHTSAFIRTPKSGDKSVRRYRGGVSAVTVLELLIGLYCAFAVWCCVNEGQFGAWCFLVIYALGFSTVGCCSIWQALTDGSLSRTPEAAPATTAEAETEAAA